MNKARLSYLSQYSDYTEFTFGLGLAARASMARSTPEWQPSNTARTPLADPMLAESTLDSALALRKFEQSIHGPTRPAYLEELKTGTAQGRIGDYSDMTWATMQDLMSRVPEDAKVRKIVPSENGSQVGFEYKWYDENGVRNRLRGHDPDPSAPANSNASNGWIFRHERGKEYYDPVTDQFKHQNSHKPSSPYYDPNAGNNTHIPMVTPDDWLIELMRWKQ